ncbi:MAG: hypothetical protein JWR51_1506 [Devosia sp.]|uniref:hypothetical protein n=1 Tax=Devosia sp. TaxID=1871048 RepID=UPI0026247723|nr:hypothetical protein [Devosia sp.]MDB5528403.1 hypothetical protein [Devosia sp.]
MFDIRLAGLPRFLVGFGPTLLPDNFDEPQLGEAMAVGTLPAFPVTGISWTRPIRPQPPRRPKASRSYLKVVK